MYAPNKSTYSHASPPWKHIMLHPLCLFSAKVCPLPNPDHLPCICLLLLGLFVDRCKKSLFIDLFMSAGGWTCIICVRVVFFIFFILCINYFTTIMPAKSVIITHTCTCVWVRANIYMMCKFQVFLFFE